MLPGFVKKGITDMRLAGHGNIKNKLECEMIIKKEGVLEFGAWLTGHDKETVEKLFDDFNNYKERSESVPAETRVSLRAVFEKIVNIINEGKCFVITEDMGDNTLTIEINGHHTHCGIPDGTLDDLIDSLYGTLVIGKGLSWE